jgi:hypothetical protein
MTSNKEKGEEKDFLGAKNPGIIINLFPNSHKIG